MSAKMKEYRYYLSSGVNTSVRVKISMLELAPGAAVSLSGDLLTPRTAPASTSAAPDAAPASTATSTAPLRAFPAPTLTQRSVASSSELRNATISEIFVTAQVFADGVPLHAMAISSKGPTKCSESTIYWNEWLTLPVRYRDLSRNAQLVLSVWGVGWQPIGGTTLRLFSTPGVLRDGMQCLRVWRGVAADSAPWTTTPGEMDDDWTNRECFRLDKLREKYERKEMARNEWMDGVTDRRIARIRRGSEPPGRRDPLGPFCSYRQDAVLWIELPYFGDIVVYEEEPYAQRSHASMTAASVMAQEMVAKRTLGSSPGVSSNSAPSSLPSLMGNDGYGYDTASASSGSGSSLVVVWDPDLHEDNPAERKYRKLARDILRGSIDPNLKPSRDEKARIEELLAMPTDALRNEDKDLLWKFRFTLTDNKKAVVKFLLSVDWNDETEVKQATDLLHQCTDFQMANYFYWYLKVEASDFGRDSDMFLAVLNQMCDEMKNDPERRPNYDMLMSQQDLMQKILQFHNKAREEKGRKDQKEEKFKQLLKGFPWPRPMVKIMVKNGDDLRQDQLIMQMFILMDRLLKKVNLDLKLTPYRILATGTTDGLMEFVQDSVPVSYIVANFESPQILSFLRSHHPDPNGPYRVSAEALSNYVKSVAGYCVLTYILGIGDRHLDNLMMKTAGHLFHIDFGFIFGADPKPYPPPFKLTKEMVEGMGGPESEHYLKFKTYCCQAYNWLRKSADLILNLLSLMADGGIEMLSNDPETTLQKVQEKFRLDLTDEQAEQFFLGLINDSVTALFPVLVEYIHKWATKLK
ncbi:hypothetical protein P43SY_007927 [Pythium insidiosum]|uniref:phosphatidylinositol 3-kinase n=1 Tax=Pythium insidiosum TaxID=114742 RepID=A0AAD5LKZ4_PYTIN|nr:hypothetical protein P43SY_007927 [Pythium insidiosum]